MRQIKTENAVITLLFAIQFVALINKLYVVTDTNWYIVTLPITIIPIVIGGSTLVWIVYKFIVKIAYYELRLLFEKIIN